MAGIGKLQQDTRTASDCLPYLAANKDRSRAISVGLSNDLPFAPGRFTQMPAVGPLTLRTHWIGLHGELPFRHAMYDSRRADCGHSFRKSWTTAKADLLP